MLVWYAAYGSNLLRERFLTYLQGGPVPGSGRIQHGARDGRDPHDDRPFRLAAELVFGCQSNGWGGGGVAFVDPTQRPPAASHSLGRAWLVTIEQLADVWAQENGQQPGAAGPQIDIDRLRSTGALVNGDGWYPRLHYLGELDGRPVATITCETVPEPNPPHQAYLTIMGRGLIETWGLSVAEAVAYLANRRGSDSSVDTEALAAAVEAGLETP